MLYGEILTRVDMGEHSSALGLAWASGSEYQLVGLQVTL